MTTLRLAITADLHFGHNLRGDAATVLLHEHLLQDPPDLLLLGGDIGTDRHFTECLQLFADLPCRKALVPGNHDVWTTAASRSASTKNTCRPSPPPTASTTSTTARCRCPSTTSPWPAP